MRKILALSLSTQTSLSYTTLAPLLFSSSFPSPINLSTTSFWSPVRVLLRRSSHSSASSQSPRSTIAMGSEEIKWPANKVRETFIKFFEDKKHINWKSSPVVPHNDPTLLFANAGQLILCNFMSF